MGNTSGKESRADNAHRSGSESHDNTNADQASSSRGGRHDMSFLGLGGRSDGPSDDTASGTRRETRQEREARRAQKERAARLKERERSMKEEGVDGGYLVTIGTYVGAEDFNKGIVRQLMVERRLAPFWRGLNDHSDSWTEHQLVAAARGKTIPAPDEIPDEEDTIDPPPSSKGTAGKSASIPVPQAQQSEQDATGFSPLSASHPAFSSKQSGSQSLPTPAPLFRGRSKTLVSLTSKSTTPTDVSPQEIMLPAEPRINGQPVEAYLYKDVDECPICFLYYPPYLNKTRCCDQPICSECFVQVKRPDPHPPEHLDPDAPTPPEPRSIEDEVNLISEPSTCPFCKTQEFGVTYEAPPFRRGLAYASTGLALSRTGSAMSSSSSLAGTGAGRRRTTSLSATDSTVITTDRIRPEWATKLAQAKAQASRRAASATALHTAAYLMGPQGSGLLGRRRRGDSRGEGPSQTQLEQLLSILESQEAARSARRESNGGNEGNSSRGFFGVRRSGRADDIEELMMMEAIRQSLAAEEDRKRKEEKEAAKQTKKDEKSRAKEQKKAEKAAKKSGTSLHSPASSSFSGGSASPNAGIIDDDEGKGKGKEAQSSEAAAAQFAFNPLNEPTSTLNAHSSRGDAKRHLEQSRANLDQGSRANGLTHGQASAQTRSTDSSPGSSFVDAPSLSSRNDSIQDSTQAKSGTALGTFAEENDPDSPPTLDPALNFSSLAAMIDATGVQQDENTIADAKVQADPKAKSNVHTGESTLRSAASTDQKHKDDVTLVEHSDNNETV